MSAEGFRPERLHIVFEREVLELFERLVATVEGLTGPSDDADQVAINAAATEVAGDAARLNAAVAAQPKE